MLREDLTVVYYTSCTEGPDFEAKIRATLQETVGTLPIISVSHKPLDFGTNICVGDVGISSQNAFRQLQIGAEQATTRFVCAAESDFLYPRDYFAFQPERTDVLYSCQPVYLLFGGRRGAFYPKRHSEGAMMVGRDYLLNAIEVMLTGLGTWNRVLERDGGRPIPFLFVPNGREHFYTTIPTVSFRTDHQMHRKTPFIATGKCAELPYWGSARDLWSKYCG